MGLSTRKHPPSEGPLGPAKTHKHMIDTARKPIKRALHKAPGTRGHGRVPGRR